MQLNDLIEPSGLGALLFLAGATSTLVRRSRPWAFPLFAASAAVFSVFSSGLAVALLMGPLEDPYPALRDPHQHPQARVIAVLTGFAIDDPEMPLSARMNASSSFRVLEAANLWSLRPDCTVVVTGSSPAAQLMAQQLLLLGIPGNLVKIDGDADNTAGSARYLKQIAGGRPVFLVTSAGHMRRALGTFRKAGMLPIPAPTDYRLPRSTPIDHWGTSPSHLQASDLAVHEYLGFAWYRLTDRL